MEIKYGINATPKDMGWGHYIACCFQQILAIMAATILVPLIVNGAAAKAGQDLVMSPAAALLGAGMGTIVYQLFVKRKSPVFLGSSFAFLGAMSAAAGEGYGFWGLILGVVFAGLVYVIIATIIHFTGTAWVNKLMQPAIIGATVALIGLSLSGTATSWAMYNGGDVVAANYTLISIVCAVFTFAIIILCSTKGNKTMRLIPFIIGILGGYVLAGIFTAIGFLAKCDYLKVLDISVFTSVYGQSISYKWFVDLPAFSIVEAFKQGWNLDGAAIGSIALMFAPVALVVFAEHIADHKNLSSIINKDLITDPGLTRTLLGDGVGSIVGAVFGGCANTTYGESISCVALSKNASTYTILMTAVMCMVVSFIAPFVAIINMIPKCVMGGACIAMYGFISVSGLQMLKDVDLGDHRNLYPVAAILVIGIGGVTLDFGTNSLTGSPLVQITSLALAMIVGIVVNYITHSGKNNEEDIEEEKPDSVVTD